MMSQKRKQRIIELAREHTIGSGRAEEMKRLGQEPKKDELTALSLMFGRITREDVHVYCSAWNEFLGIAE